MFFFGAHGGGLVQVVWFRAPCSLRSAVPQAVMIPLGLYRDYTRALTLYRNGTRELAFYRNCTRALTFVFFFFDNFFDIICERMSSTTCQPFFDIFF